MQQSPAVNTNRLLPAKRNATIKHALCAVHRNDSHKKLRAKGIPIATSERTAYV